MDNLAQTDEMEKALPGLEEVCPHCQGSEEFGECFVCNGLRTILTPFGVRVFELVMRRRRQILLGGDD
jgi:hypothetical protein